jgi:acetoin utilization protein AcuB
MSKTIPTIQKYMSTSPHSIGTDQSLAVAEKMMQQYKIRHLPVLDGGKLVGIISDRDIKFLESFKDVDPTVSKIKDVSVESVFTVEPDSKLDEVCDVMAEKKYGCAVVMSNHKLVGIFTWVDALRAMSELLKTRLSK